MSQTSTTCPACCAGRWWISPDGKRIQLCEEHEELIADETGWSWMPDKKAKIIPLKDRIKR